MAILNKFLRHSTLVCMLFGISNVALSGIVALAEDQAGQAGHSQEGVVSRSTNRQQNAEESLLASALKALRADNLTEAINNLAKLKDEFPDNDDYALMYRTAVRKKNSSDGDSQKWYAYERAVENKNSSESGQTLHPYEPPKTVRALTVRASGRINQLKKATWVVLTTGKHRSSNAGRRTPAPASTD